MKRFDKTTEKVYDYIVTYKCSEDGNSPSIREIMEHFGFKSTSVPVYHLKKLEALGYITIADGARGIYLKSSKWLPPKGWIPPEERK